MFRDKIATEPIPERVYCLCKNVEKYGPISSSDLKDKMEPDYLNEGSSTSYYPAYRAAAEEMGLIVTSDNVISIAVDSKVLASIGEMRRYINSQLQRYPSGHFFKVTRTYFQLGDEILKGEQNVSHYASSFAEKLKDNSITVDTMRGWRFWAGFLGFGVRSSDMFIIPNAYIFLVDCIKNAKLEKGRIYSMTEFIESLRPSIDIIVDPMEIGRTLNFGVSNGLRMLHDFGIIKMERVMDNEDGWTLYNMPAHPVDSVVTTVTILK